MRQRKGRRWASEASADNQKGTQVFLAIIWQGYNSYTHFYKKPLYKKPGHGRQKFLDTQELSLW